MSSRQPSSASPACRCLVATLVMLAAPVEGAATGAAGWAPSSSRGGAATTPPSAATCSFQSAVSGVAYPSDSLKAGALRNVLSRNEQMLLLSHSRA